MAALAQTGIPINSVFQPAEKFQTIGKLVTVLVQNIMVIAGVLLFVLLIFGGLQFIIGAGSGDKEGVGKGKNAITAAIIGFILIITAYWIVQIIGYIAFGNKLNIFNPGV